MAYKYSIPLHSLAAKLTNQFEWPNLNILSWQQLFTRLWWWLPRIEVDETLVTSTDNAPLSTTLAWTNRLQDQMFPPGSNHSLYCLLKIRHLINTPNPLGFPTKRKPIFNRAFYLELWSSGTVCPPHQPQPQVLMFLRVGSVSWNIKNLCEPDRIRAYKPCTEGTLIIC